MRPLLLALAFLTLAPCAWADTGFHFDDRFSASVPSLPYGLDVGGELGASWQFWGDNPLPKLPPAGLALGEPWHYGFVRTAVDANSSVADSHAGVTALLEPVGILQFKANLSRDWRTVPGSDDPIGAGVVGQVDRHGLEGELIPIPWPYGYAGYDGTWERLSPSGAEARGFLDPSSQLLVQPGGDTLVTHLFFIEWIPHPRINVLAFAIVQQMQGSGEWDDIQGVRTDLLSGKLLYTLTLGRWEGPHTQLPAFIQLSLTWVGMRALDR